MQEIINELTDRNILKIDNTFVLSNLNYNSLALDVFLILVAQVKNEDSQFYTYQTQLSNLSKILKKRVKKEQVIEAMQIAFTSFLKVKNGERFSGAPLFSKFDYNNGQITFKINPEIKDLILNLKINYTLVNLTEFLTLKTFYAKRLYLIMKQFENAKECYLTLNTLYDSLNVNATRLYGNFKQDILVPSLKEIKENTTLEIEYKESKDKDKVFSLSFKIKNATVKKKKLNGLQKWVLKQETF